MGYFITLLILIIMAFIIWRIKQKKEIESLPDDPGYIEPKIEEEEINSTIPQKSKRKYTKKKTDGKK